MRQSSIEAHEEIKPHKVVGRAANVNRKPLLWNLIN